LYTKQDVYSLVASEVDLLTFKHKWDVLKATYSGESGSTTIFNMWINLTQAKLDDSTPLAPQLAKLKETRVALSNASMGVTDTQYSLILLNTLPPSYEAVATILLASGLPTSLKASEITARLINEEGCHAGPSTSLNMMAKAPIKGTGKGKKKDHSNLTCHYCQKKGHIQLDCHKKKKDDADKKKKEESGSGSGGNKAANSHVLVPTSASIEEVNDNIGVALYAAERVHWMMDSGATHHITPHRSDFKDYTPCKGSVRLGDKSTIDQVGVSSVIFTTSLGTPITLSNVLHIPQVKTRFMSTRTLAQKGAEVSFTQSSFKIIVNQHHVAEGYLEDNLYWLDASSIGLNAHVKRAATLDTWHQRMGHMSHAALKSYGPSALTGMDLDSSTTAPTVCCGCKVGKSTRKPFSVSSTKRTSAILEVVHSDLTGPTQTKSLQGSYYTATFIDDHSKLAVVYFITSKDQFAKVFNMYLLWAETQTTLKLKALHSDCGGEYMAKAVQDTLKQRGIEHHLTRPGSPQSNGKAEWFNRTITDKAMAMLHTAGLSFGFWEYAMNAAVHIYNRSPTCTLKWHTPYELWYSGKVPDVSHIRIFGCKGYMHVPADKHHKLDVKAIEVMLVGFEPGAKGYQLWDKQTHSVRLSRDVTFDESSFPSQKGVETHPAPIPPVPVIAVPNPAARPPFHIEYPVRAPSPTQSQSSAEDVENLLDPQPSTPPSFKVPLPPPNTPQTPKQECPAPTLPPPRPSAMHIKHEPVSPGQDMPGSFTDRIQRSELLHEMDNAPRQLTCVPVPNPWYHNTDNVAIRGWWLGYAELLAAAYVGRDPASYSEAMRSADADQWSEACQYEIDALAKNGTWELVDLLPGRKAVKSKWVFKLKVDGRYHARLVAKGFTQIPGVDFDETFSPVARFESLCMLLALATLEDWHIHQMDVKSAFLNGMLDEEIFMEQPQGFITTGSETQVSRLCKVIYGLKQASRQWNLQFHGVLTGLSFKQMYADAGIHVCHQQEGDGPLFVILYVDDITILGRSLQAVQRLKSDLSMCYEMSDLREIESYLGICITHDRAHKRLEIDRSGYLSNVLEHFGMADASPHNTPLPTGADEHLKKFDGQASASDIKHYQSLIGSMLYLQIGMRPDISFAVSRLVQYTANPSPQHLRLVQYILSYLVGTVDTCLVYDGASGDGLYGYSDSSLGDQADDRHSTSGYVFLLAHGAISWSSHKQKTVAQNTTEAEYMAMIDAANQAAWYESFLTELGYEVNDPIPLHGDNKGTIDLAFNPVTGRRSKHIAIRHHVIREYIEKGTISLICTPTAECGWFHKVTTACPPATAQ
jgi:hypothetical protein